MFAMAARPRAGHFCLRASISGSGATEMAAKKATKPLSKKQAWEKRLNGQYARFKGLENRQKMVEKARRAVYEYLVEMVHENIEHAKKGNSSVAKFLMNFAGIEQLPVAAPSKRKKTAYGCGCEATDDPMKAVRAFSEKVGIPFPKLKPPKPVEAVEEPSDHVQSTV
jgi:hypothetical protein